MKDDPLHKDDLEEFVLEGINTDEELRWFERPNFGAIWRAEFQSSLTKGFLFLAGFSGILYALSLVFSIFATVFALLFITALGAVILRLSWIYYLGRRLSYVITSKRLLYLLEVGRPIEYKSYFLSEINIVERQDLPDGSAAILLPEQDDGLYGLDEAGTVEQLLCKVKSG
ncbi:hypothetical protein [Kiloniella antarctica]|uniref:DUF304 domain-containing protein n=1 Tax=Kiloniella antarctica TaxID=1550907 RepID=A0ABW5BMU0_9PROT